MLDFNITSCYIVFKSITSLCEEYFLRVTKQKLSLSDEECEPTTQTNKAGGEIEMQTFVICCFNYDYLTQEKMKYCFIKIYLEKKTIIIGILCDKI